MILDWSNIGAYSRGYGFALDHGLEYLVDPPGIKFLVGLSMISHFLKTAKSGIEKNGH